MPVRWAIANGDWSNTATWNDGATLGIPTGSDDIFTNTFNVNVNQSFSVISLNNTTRARDIATPAMTANNAPSPFVAAASAEGTALAFNAFNRVYTTTTGWQTNVGVPQWLSFDFGSGSSIVIDGYTIFGFNDVRSNPNTWQLQGSNNNSTWTTIHSVSGNTVPANGTYSIASIGNPIGYRYYRLNVTAVGGGTWGNVSITELELYQPGTAALAAGGSFVFNSGSISGSATSTTAALTAGATNLIQVTATTGSVGLTIGSAITGLSTTSTQIFNHTGNCDFRLSGLTFTGGSAASAFCINKSSTGTINITGSLVGGSNSSALALNATAGNTIVLGNVAGASGAGISHTTSGNITVIGNVTAGTTNVGIFSSVPTAIVNITGNVVGSTSGGTIHGLQLTGASSQFTIIGNVTGGGASSTFGISHSGTSGSVIGNITGGSGGSAHGISTVGTVTVTGTVTGGAGSNAQGINTSGVVTITGNVNGAAGGGGLVTTANAGIIGNVTGGSIASAIGTASTVTISVTGTVSAGTVQGINLTGAGTVNLTGNMINVSGRQAIFAQNLFISNAATTQWRLFTQGGQDKTLYSADTFPNQPSAANVRSGSLYGPANALSGSMVVPAPSDVRVNVLTDNTVGTGQSLTAADFLAAISSSADPFAQRLRNVATVDTVGSLVTGLNGGF